MTTREEWVKRYFSEEHQGLNGRGVNAHCCGPYCAQCLVCVVRRRLSACQPTICTCPASRSVHEYAEIIATGLGEESP